MSVILFSCNINCDESIQLVVMLVFTLYDLSLCNFIFLQDNLPFLRAKIFNGVLLISIKKRYFCIYIFFSITASLIYE